MFLEYSPKSDHWVKLLEEGCALSYLKKKQQQHESFKLKMGNLDHRYLLHMKLEFDREKQNSSVFRFLRRDR